MLFIFLALITISYVHAATPFSVPQSVLITCKAGDGCVTETRVAVACPFIKSSETAVMRAIKTRSGQFSVVRIASIESEDAANGIKVCNPIELSRIPKTPVRVSEDFSEDLELQVVEHFVSPMGNITLSVTRLAPLLTQCMLTIKRNIRHLDTKGIRLSSIPRNCKITIGGPSNAPLENTKTKKSTRLSGSPEDVPEDQELELVEHFVSPMGNITLLVTRQSSLPRQCALSISRNNRHLDTKGMRISSALQNCKPGIAGPSNTSPEKSETEKSTGKHFGVRGPKGYHARHKPHKN